MSERVKIYTPMIEQYLDIKEENKDTILFYRVGDFYEMFFDDALVASKELEITLTGKNCGLEERAPMCGVPLKNICMAPDKKFTSNAGAPWTAFARQG